MLMTALCVTLQPAGADQVDVMVQAGHEGRPQSCAALRVKACNLGTGLGAQLERNWTPVVADAAAAALRKEGYVVKRRPADYAGHDRARAAVFLHFDGSAPACRSGASVGFPQAADAAFARAWETAYRPRFPFRFAGENITKNEAQYYGFRKVDAPRRTLLIEFGEMTCSAQERWLAPRLHELGIALARFIDAELRS
jgi:hypothetical protein